AFASSWSPTSAAAGAAGVQLAFGDSPSAVFPLALDPKAKKPNLNLASLADTFRLAVAAMTTAGSGSETLSDLNRVAFASLVVPWSVDFRYRPGNPQILRPGAQALQPVLTTPVAIRSELDTAPAALV